MNERLKINAWSIKTSTQNLLVHSDIIYIYIYTYVHMYKESEIKSLPVTCASLVAEISSEDQSQCNWKGHNHYQS